MSYTLSTAARNAACDAIVDLVDSGTTNTEGKLQFRNSTTLIAEIDLNQPAFGAAASGVASLDTAGGLQGTVSPAGSSTIDRFRIIDRDSNNVFDGDAGSVATSGGDINLSSVSVNQNDVVEVTSLTVTIPASSGV